MIGNNNIKITMNKKTKQVELSDLVDDLTFIPRAIAQEMIEEQIR